MAAPTNFVRRRTKPLRLQLNSRERWGDYPQLTVIRDVRGRNHFQHRRSSPSLGGVALLGFAYRHISVKFTQKTRKPSQPKPLPASVKTMADWIQVKLHEKGMAPYQLAEKMGIASVLVKTWKDGTVRPNAGHIREMITILGKFCRATKS